MDIHKILISVGIVSIFSISSFGSTDSYYIKDGSKHYQKTSPAHYLNVPNGSDEMGFYCDNTTDKNSLWTKEIITVSPQCFETVFEDKGFHVKKIGANIVEVTYDNPVPFYNKIDGVWELKYYKNDTISTIIGFKGCERKWDRIRSKHEIFVSPTKNGNYKKMCEAYFSYQIQRDLADPK